ncbi:MAG: LysM peptidoglycan-binding domain-containing protein [Cyclobacteriaceae bacterium]|nr:LysM peptidoglycan-binding domain-containing protein [Cyclobacteriaceae bacterium]
MKLAAALVLVTAAVFAQAPEVPDKMQFAGITLTIRDDARREIQKDVNMLTQSAKHHTIKVERAKTYFPIIEKIFAEENVPDDFKYLVLQESALIADAVSVSNAVGFWQFKDFTAVEMGLRVDKEIDERMNIVSATRGAARYIKKNNYYFNNWVYALQAYQMGAGGTMKAVKDYQSGTKHMTITSETYWYVKKFLAHKIAFENYVKGPGEVKVYTITNRTKRSIKEVADEFAIDEEQLRQYNKWVRKDHIPDDKSYMLSIPTIGESAKRNAAIARAESSNPLEPPKRIDAEPARASTTTMMLHGIPAIKAIAGETPSALAKRADVDLSGFLRYNDISVSDRINAGKFYYLKRKKTRGPVSHHVVIVGDNLWSISQQYGVQLRKLERYNKIDRDNTLKEGSVIYLTGKRTVEAVPEAEEPAVEIETGDTFNWTVQPQANPVPDVPATPLPPQQTPVEPKQELAQPDSVKADTISFDQHVVVAGETLYSIAKRFEVGVMQVAEWNNLSLSDGIKPGQILRLRKPSETLAAPAATEVIHTVKASDTLYSIAREYGVTIKELMDWNKKKDFALSVGEKLVIVKKP